MSDRAREVLAQHLITVIGDDGSWSNGWSTAYMHTDAILAALAGAGLVVVPKEPTTEMRVAAAEAVATHRAPTIQKLRENDSPGWCVHSVYSSHESNEVWRAMISAASLPAAQPSAGER